MTPAQYETKYPPRKAGIITRFAPSPTGYLHIGGLLAALVEERIAHQDGGIFYLRIEDTDKKREVENGVSAIIEAFSGFPIVFDEGPVDETNEKGAYGPYVQSRRKAIYQAYCKELLRQGKAYTCFLSEAELEGMKKDQEKSGVKTGCYGRWARHRDITPDDAKARIERGEPYVFRLRSSGSDIRRIEFTDAIRGRIEMPENDFDIVLLKTDGLPTYHFAHAVDDHLMRTTHVIRGEEWLSSVPVHLELFASLGFNAPVYAHISPIMKEDGTSRRKLSKRHDPEAAVHFYHEAGYPVSSVIEYLMNFIDTGYEEWRAKNPLLPVNDFRIDLSRMSVSGGLFDMQKLASVSQDVISRTTAEDVYESALTWAKRYDSPLADILTQRRELMLSIFASGRGGPKARKDIAKWSDIPSLYDHFITDDLNMPSPMHEVLVSAECRRLLSFIHERVANTATIDSAFVQGILKDAQKEIGVKGKALYHPIRYALTARESGLDLDAIFMILGKERTLSRLKNALEG
ncbi:MAG: glutamate--tRNA ligase [Spirochaetota bacterium]